MTSPQDPNIIVPPVLISQDPLMTTLPGAVIAQQESSTVLRVGVVTAIMEGSQITVRISGSDVLVNCSYLFFQYFPLAGDRVVVLKQDSQWICLGQMTGSIDSNNPLSNSSFEQGVLGALPTGWTLTTGAVVAGVPTFTSVLGSSSISGVRNADFGTDSIVAGISTAQAFSPPVPATPGTKWTSAYFLISASIGSLIPRFSTLELHIQFLDPGSVVLADNLVNTLSVGADVVGPIYRRLSLGLFPDGFVVAPAGTAFVRATFAASFDIPATSFASFFIDNVILRQVD